MRWIVLLGMVIATPAMAAEQQSRFDLQCGKGRDAVRYRVDLDRGEWCSEDCKRTFKIASVTAGELVLEDKMPQLPGQEESSIRISRVTGEWSEYYATSRASAPTYRTGMCEAAAFTGFPNPRF